MNFSPNKLFLIAVLAVLSPISFLVSSAAAQRKVIKKAPPPAPPRKRDNLPVISKDMSPAQSKYLRTFNQIWEKLDQFYYDKTFGGVNWQGIYTEYFNKSYKAANDDEFHSLMQEMIGLLSGSHLVIITLKAYEKLEATKEVLVRAETKVAESKVAETAGETPHSEDENETVENEQEDQENVVKNDPLESKLKVLSESFQQSKTVYGTGISLIYIDDQLLITDVAADSPAERAGIKKGSVIEEINGVAVSQIITILQSEKSLWRILRAQIRSFFDEILFTSEKGKKILLKVNDGSSASRQVVFERNLAIGGRRLLMTDLPEMVVTFEAKLLDAETGYIHFNAFAPEVVGKICQAVNLFKSQKNLIVDVRGNVGGALSAINGIGGILSPYKREGGKFVSRNSWQKNIFMPSKNAFRGRVILLADRASYSAAEILVSSLRESGSDVIVVGEKTAGATLSAVSIRLESGGGFQYPIGSYFSPSGEQLEGVGAKTDVEVSWKRQDLLQNRDVFLETSLNLLKTPSKYDEIIAVKKAFTAQIEKQRKSDLTAEPLETSPPSAASTRKSDPRAVAVLEKYFAVIGLKNLAADWKTLHLTGESVTSIHGAVVAGKSEVFIAADGRQMRRTNFYNGQSVREMLNETYRVSGDTMGEMYFNPASVVELNNVERWTDIFRFKDNFGSITFADDSNNPNPKLFDLIEAENKRGGTLKMVFQKSDGLLKLVGTAGGLIYLENYQPVGKMLFPLSWKYKNSEINFKSGEQLDKIDEKWFEMPDYCELNP